MPIFEFQAKKKDGSSFTGTVEAPNEEAVFKLLSDKQYYPLVVRKKSKGIGGNINITFLTRIKVKDLVIFARQLAVMSEATVPLVQALRILVDQTENEKLKKIIADVGDEVDGGSKFSQALAKHEKVFGNFFISMIRSGETSGRLDEVLNYLADQQEKDYDLMSKVRGAMIYPAFIISSLIVVGFVMMIFVVPKMTDILTQAGSELPLPTKILIFTSDFMVSYWWLVLGGMVGLAVGLKFGIRNKKFKKLWDLLQLKVPVFGNLLQRIYLVRVTRSLVTLVQGGVPLPQALEITSAIVGNQVYRDLLDETKKEVDDGNPLASVFLRSKHVPAMVSQMMNLGEQTGRLDQVLSKLTDFYSREIENLVANLVSLIEPMIMIIMGVAVGGMVAAIILPMYSVATTI